MYGYKRDNGERPVIIINTRRMIDSKIEIDQLVTMADIFLSYTIEHGMVPGHVENWTAIFDLNGVGMTEIPKSMI